MSETVKAVQKALAAGGYYKDLIDGIWGKRSQAALDEAVNSRPVAKVGRLGQVSLDRLVGVNAKLVEVVKLAAGISTVDFIVVEGLRSRARQAVLYAQGRTTAGAKVTWTLNSKHIDGLAVDLAPINGGRIDWGDLAAFNAINAAMQKAADQLGVKIRWGADWNQNGKPRERGESDSPHFELA